MLHRFSEDFVAKEATTRREASAVGLQAVHPDWSVLSALEEFKRDATVGYDQPLVLNVAGADVMVNCSDFRALMTRLHDKMIAREGFAVATLNLDHLVKMQESKAFQTAYRAHDIIVADGNPIVWMSRLARRPINLVPGSDVIVPVCKLAAALRVPVAFLGSTVDSLQKAADTLQAQIPGLDIVAQVVPGMDFDPESQEARDALDKVQESGARFCLVALGAPKQERLAGLARVRTPDIGYMSVGAGLDFIAGTQRRAPRIVRMMAMEWVWRLLGDPARLGMRYAKCAAILPGFLWQAWRIGHRAAAAEQRPEARSADQSGPCRGGYGRTSGDDVKKK